MIEIEDLTTFIETNHKSKIHICDDDSELDDNQVIFEEWQPKT